MGNQALHAPSPGDDMFFLCFRFFRIVSRHFQSRQRSYNQCSFSSASLLYLKKVLQGSYWVASFKKHCFLKKTPIFLKRISSFLISRTNQCCSVETSFHTNSLAVMLATLVSMKILYCLEVSLPAMASGTFLQDRGRSGLILEVAGHTFYKILLHPTDRAGDFSKCS